ncbi:hypothetical protein J3E68DRAFT_331642 [Trichoderma sp. SZMC 28012]
MGTNSTSRTCQNIDDRSDSFPFLFLFMLDMCFMQPADAVCLLLCPNSHGHHYMDSVPFRRVLGQCKSSLPRQRPRQPASYRESKQPSQQGRFGSRTKDLHHVPLRKGTRPI